MSDKVLFMQKDFNGLLAGTVVEVTEPDNLHVYAAALVRPQVPCAYVRIPGSEEVYMVPRFEGLLDEFHPDHPRNVSKPTLTSLRVGHDKLPKDGKGYMMAIDKKPWPLCALGVCVDPDAYRHNDKEVFLESIKEDILALKESCIFDETSLFSQLEAALS